MARITRYRRVLAIAMIGMGLAAVTTGAWLETRNPRSNVEDAVAWCVLASGMFVLGVGVSLPFARPLTAVLTGIASPFVGWCLLSVFYWTALSLNRWPTQEQMVPSGYRMIAEAKQIDDLLGPAWHELSNYQEPDVAEWQSAALFGGRYELWMWVSVRVDRSSGRVTEVVGEPRFRLLEIEEIRNSGEVLYHGNHQREFGRNEWRQFVAAQGDLSSIDVASDGNGAVAGFDRYKAAPRNGIQMRSRDDAAPLPIR